MNTTFSHTVTQRHRTTIDATASRVAAAVVATIAATSAISGWWLFLAPLTADFVVRLTIGPRWSPVARFAAWVVAHTPLTTALTPGPPKRFAQGVGLAFSVVALALGAAGNLPLAAVVAVALSIAAGLEALFGWCAGCVVYRQAASTNLGRRWGFVCEDCTLP